MCACASSVCGKIHEHVRVLAFYGVGSDTSAPGSVGLYWVGM